VHACRCLCACLRAYIRLLFLWPTIPACVAACVPCVRMYVRACMRARSRACMLACVRAYNRVSWSLRFHQVLLCFSRSIPKTYENTEQKPSSISTHLFSQLEKLRILQITLFNNFFFNKCDRILSVSCNGNWRDISTVNIRLF